MLASIPSAHKTQSGNKTAKKNTNVKEKEVIQRSSNITGMVKKENDECPKIGRNVGDKNCDEANRSWNPKKEEE